MALNNATYELEERKDRDIQQVDEDDGSIHAAERSSSLSSREERDRTELMRLGKVPVLKVRSLLRPFSPRHINWNNTRLTPSSSFAQAQLWVHVYLGIYNDHSRHMGRSSDVSIARRSTLDIHAVKRADTHAPVLWVLALPSE
jgi:hypothetical protein